MREHGYCGEHCRHAHDAHAPADNPITHAHDGPKHAAHDSLRFALLVARVAKNVCSQTWPELRRQLDCSSVWRQGLARGHYAVPIVASGYQSPGTVVATLAQMTSKPEESRQNLPAERQLLRSRLPSVILVH